MNKHFFLGSGIILILIVVGGCGKKPTNSDIPVVTSSVDTVTRDVETPKVERFPDDLDRDGIDNETERQMGLSETEFDTDGDGLSDWQEIHVFKTDPTKIDTDGDGYSDAEEILNGYNPNGLGKIPTT
jgi:hypothetical protein